MISELGGRGPRREAGPIHSDPHVLGTWQMQDSPSGSSCRLPVAWHGEALIQARRSAWRSRERGSLLTRVCSSESGITLGLHADELGAQKFPFFFFLCSR